MLEDPYGQTDNVKPTGKTMLPWQVLVLIVLVLLVLLYARPAFADPIAVTKSGDITITLYSEDCALKEVSNLPRRATWVEGNKTFEGCWGPTQFEVVMMYFAEDRTAAVVPVQVFQRVSGA
jgi:hypothetical protein